MWCRCNDCLTTLHHSPLPHSHIDIHPHINMHTHATRTGVGVAAQGDGRVVAEGQRVAVRGAGDGAVDIELIDDEVRLVPPA